MGGMDSIIAEFLAESVENLDQLDQDLVSLEKNPEDREVFARIFRTIHTIKGTCGFLAFQKLEAVTHVGESLLSRLRDGTLDLRPEITTDLLVMIDAVRAILANIDGTGGRRRRRVHRPHRPASGSSNCRSPRSPTNSRLQPTDAHETGKEKKPPRSKKTPRKDRCGSPPRSKTGQKAPGKRRRRNLPRPNR